MSEQQDRPQPTTEEQRDAAETESYVGVPISDEELADVWTSTKDEGDAKADPQG